MGKQTTSYRVMSPCTQKTSGKIMEKSLRLHSEVVFWCLLVFWGESLPALPRPLQACPTLVGRNSIPAYWADSIPTHRMVLQSGLAIYFGDILVYRACQLSAAWAGSDNHQIGLRGGWLFYDGEAAGRGEDVFIRGYDVGAFGKFFFYNPIKERRSNLYLGVELRAGQRRFLHFDAFKRPQYSYQSRTVSAMLNLGWQKQWGRCVLEVSCPIGLERLDVGFPARSVSPGDGYVSFYPVAMPVLSLGVRL